MSDHPWIPYLIGASLVGSIAAPAARASDLPAAAYLARSPYDLQVGEQRANLSSTEASVRRRAAEALGYLRAYGVAEDLAGALDDEAEAVRRAAALSLGWCGGHPAVERLVRALDDRGWSVQQAASVALNNLTGQEFPFDALAASGTRRQQTTAWRDWWAAVPPGGEPSPEVLELVRDDDRERRLRGVRALGALGGAGAREAVLGVLEPYLRREYRRLDKLDRHLAQACVRSLGRLGDRRSLPLLLGLLETASWARYAADALGDLGARQAVSPLAAAYPRFSRHLDNRFERPELCPADDRFTGDNTQDRMFETPHAIAQALSRLPLDDPAAVAALREMAPYLLANTPSDWDGGVLYEPEGYQHVTAYLLERAGLRRVACDAAFESAARSAAWFQERPPRIAGRDLPLEEVISRLAMKVHGDVPYMASWFPALCREERDVPRLIGLLEHENGWVRINVIKALMFLEAKQAVEPIARLLAQSKPEREYGFSGVLEHEEYNDPSPRWREACVRALGRLAATRHTGTRHTVTPHTALLVSILEDDRNVVDLSFAAAQALDELGTKKALAALRSAEARHPFHSIRLLAREALFRRGLEPEKRKAAARAPPTRPVLVKSPSRDGGETPRRYVFIKGDKRMRSDFNGQAGVDPWRQTYTVNNSAPTMRIGRNLHVLNVGPDGEKDVAPLTHFDGGYVADCEVSWDGERVIFCRRRNDDHRNISDIHGVEPRLRRPGEFELDGDDDPWWHVWEIGADGTGLRQITRGPYHHVQPAYLPDGRLVFCSTRLGLRDEYHGYVSTGLTVMNADGSDLHVIGFNLGGDREPAILPDGRIVFSRLDVFYSRFKSELTVQAVYPDGTKNVALYGPERRGFWMDVHRKYAAWTMRGAYGGSRDNRNRVLRISQPQPFEGGRLVCATSGGLAVVGPGRNQETLVPHDRKWAVTSPYPLGNGKILCAATIKQFRVKENLVTGGTEEFVKLRKGPSLFRSAVNIDHGLYIMDAASGEMELLYNDPETADFEARPLEARQPPKMPAEGPRTREDGFTARLFCASARISRDARVRSRGKLLRVIEGQPFVSRHQDQNSVRPSSSNRWKNHGGTHARVLATLPLAADGSFHVEVPADRLLQLQVLDSDRRVLGNQTFWMYARPGETRSCIGCHEKPDIVMAPGEVARSLLAAPLQAMPTGDEFSYRAKFWLKGDLPDEAEERTRTARAVNLIARH